MEKQKRWQFYLILTVLVLTLYNILPTIFFYSKPLKEPINAARAQETSLSIVNRINNLEEDSVAWLRSFSKLLGVKPSSIALKANDPKMIDVTFNNPKEATTFKRFLPRAGTLVPFVPAQLALDAVSAEDDASKTVTVVRQIGVRLDPAEVDQLFVYSPKYDENGALAPLYRDLVYDRATQLGLAFGGSSKTASQINAINQSGSDARYDDAVITTAKEIVEADQTFGKIAPLQSGILRHWGKLKNKTPMDWSKNLQRVQRLLRPS